MNRRRFLKQAGAVAGATSESGISTAPWRSARGGAYCDFDNDGKIDILVSNIDDRPQLLENTGQSLAKWIELKLVGTRSNRDAIGAHVKVQSGDLVQYDHVRAGGSFLSSNDPRLHFGLGEHTVIDFIEIQWPSGLKERLTRVKSNQFIVIKEGSGILPYVSKPFHGNAGSTR